MAKEKKPQYVSPYKEVIVSENIDENTTIEFPVEVVDDAEISQQKAIRWECVKRTAGLYKEKTLISYGKRHEKLFDCKTEEEVIQQVISCTGPSMTPLFKYRSFANILESKMALIEREDYKKLMKITINSLNTYGCIHPKVKDILGKI